MSKDDEKKPDDWDYDRDLWTHDKDGNLVSLDGTGSEFEMDDCPEDAELFEMPDEEKARCAKEDASKNGEKK